LSTLAIIGAGISGLLTAYYALSNRTISQITLFEQRAKIPRKHCAGIISPETLSLLPYGLKYVENKYRNIEFHILPYIRITLRCSNIIAYKIDRVNHEMELYRILITNGIDIQLSKKILMIDTKGKSNLVIHDLSTNDLIRKRFDYIIISEGYPNKLSLDIGLNAMIRSLHGIQQDVIYSSKNVDKDTLYIFIDPIIFGEGFGWFIPVTEDRGVIGLACNEKPIEMLSIFRKILSKRLKMSINSMADVYGGKVLQGYPKSICRNNICALGDAIGMVKSISGGGLYAISRMSNVYARNIGIDSIARQKEVREMLSELWIQYIFKRSIWRIVRMLKNSMLLTSTFSIELEVSQLDYDRHERLPLNLIRYLISFKLRQG